MADLLGPHLEANYFLPFAKYVDKYSLLRTPLEDPSSEGRLGESREVLLGHSRGPFKERPHNMLVTHVLLARNVIPSFYFLCFHGPTAFALALTEATSALKSGCLFHVIVSALVRLQPSPWGRRML